MELKRAVNPEQVWQRVHGETKEQPLGDVLLSLIAGEMTDAATYLMLSRKITGKAALALRRLFEEEQSHVSCLKGIYILMTGERPVIRTAQPETAAPQIALRRCYGREMHCLAAYEARSRDPEYGPVFARLAAQEQGHCKKLLEILGALNE